MASESAESASLTVTLPEDLDQWIDEQAAKLDVDRETVLVQLLASYRAMIDADERVDADGEVPAAGIEAIADAVERNLARELEDRIEVDVEPIVESILADRLEAQVESEVQSQLQTAIESVIGERIEEATDAVREQLTDRLDGLEDDYTTDLDDVRERVVQVKKETDKKAPADHGHEEFDRLTDLSERLADLTEQVGDMETAMDDLDSTVADHDETITAHDEAVADVESELSVVQDRLQTVAWVVNDLREAQSHTDPESVERIKRAAARADVDRAKCENCTNGVEIALLTDPECPHCEATVTDFEPSDGFFGNPRLLAASQLESGDDE
ncbi:MAG: chromosome segregation ATPase [Haloarculaceae archaeon]|jgi:chromosome segregation ATPase